MAKTFGFIACTTLVVASVWVANTSSPVKTIEAGSGSGGQGQFQVGGVRDQRSMSAKDYFEMGKRYYRIGQMAQAIAAFEKAQTASGPLTMYERNDLKRYLARSKRGSSTNATAAPASRQVQQGGAYAIARQMLDDARMHAARGEVGRATQLAERANSFPVTWNSNELSPAQFLAELRSGKNPAEIGIAQIPESAPSQPAIHGNMNSAAPAIGNLPQADENPFEPPNRELVSNSEQPKFRSAPRSRPRTSAAGTPSADPPGNLTVKQQAVQLVDEARAALLADDYELAREKAVAANNLNVSWGLFEDRPEQVLKAVERRTGVVKLEGNQRIATAPPLPIDEMPEVKPTVNPLPIAAKPASPPFEAKTPADTPQTQLPETPVADSVPFKQPAVIQTTPQTPSSETELSKARKLQSANLLSQAKQDAAAGRFEAARQKVAQAEKIDVVYGLFDERPQLVAQEIAQLESNTLLAKRKAKPFPPAGQTPTTTPDAETTRNKTGIADNKAANAKVQALLAAARRALKEGNLDEAKQKTAEASSFEVAFGLFDDRPDLVLAQISAAESDVNTMIADNGQTDEPVTVQKPNADDIRVAQNLLQAARKDISDNRYEEARKKAHEAEKLNVAYGPFDDRPENVLADVRRLAARANVDKLESGNAPGDTTNPPAIAIQPKTSPVKNGDYPAQMSERRIAKVLLKQAREDMAAGRLDEARRKAEEAQSLKVTYNLFDDRPENVIEDINRLLSKNPPTTQQQLPVAQTPPPAVNPSTENPFAASTPGESEADLQDTLAVVRPSGVSAIDLYNRGLLELRQGNQDAAYASFLEAHRSGQQLDPRKAQQLQDFLRTLRPSRKQPITLVSGETTGDAAVAPADGSEPGRIDIVERQMAVKFDRLRTEMLNAIFRAERLKEKNPDAALNVLEQTMAEVEKSDLPKEAVGPLLRQLQNSKRSIQGYMKQREPIIALNKRNEEVEAEIRRIRENEVRVEQDLAELVEEYNNLFRQRRYAEAEVLAKQAEDLQPDNPVVVTMKWKARFARRNQRINETRDAAEDTRVNVNHDLDDDLVFGVNDKSPIDFGDPKEWKELTKRREKYGAPDNRRRTDEEKRIEKSLNRQISLHFDEAPISEVMAHVQAVTDVNIWLDGLGLQDEGVSTDQPVTIHVDGIMLKSALNLLLKPMHLAYTIEDEVLKVTSRMREQGQQIVVTYPVADLVVPIPNFSGHSGATGISANGTAISGFGASGGNMSVPTGGMQPPAGAHFQVNDAVGANGFAPDPWSGPGMNSPRTTGGAAADFDTLSSLIVQTIEPDSWNEVGGPGSVNQFETTLSLVIRQTQKVHDEIKDLLEQLRRLQDLQVTIEVRFITVADRFFERIGVDFDFNVQDTVGSDPTALPFGTVDPNALVNQAGQQAQAGQGQVGQGVGGIGGGVDVGGVLPFPMGLQGSNPAMGVGGIGGQNQAGQAQQGQQQQGQQGQQGQAAQAGVAGAAGFFDPPNTRALTAQDNWPKGGTIVGLSAPGTFTPDLDVAFRQGSFDIGVPDFGGFNPDAGIQVGLAILSDIEAFFFIQAAQGDERSNLLFAPKVTLFNGQQATVQSTVQRPFVTSLIPTVGFFSVGFTPQITVLSEGVTLTVQAVISADRRFVRLTVVPSFTNITDVFTFSFQSSGAGGAQQGVQGLGGGAGGVTGQGSGVGGFGGGGLGGAAGQGVGGIGGGGQIARVLPFPMGLRGSNPAIGMGGIGGQVGQVGQVGQAGQAGQVGQVGQQGNQQGQGAFAAGNITIQQPVFEIVNVTTTVSVPDGGTVLLGGVKRLREGRNMAGVPILNKIPYISRLFKNTGVGRETESLMLMVTPRIIIQEEEEELLGIP